MTFLLFPQACGVGHQVCKLFRGSLQAWLCFSLDDCHLPPVSSPLSSHCPDSQVHGTGVRNPALVTSDVLWRKLPSCVLKTVDTWKGLRFSWFSPWSHSALAIPYPHPPASTACFCGEEGGDGASVVAPWKSGTQSSHTRPGPSTMALSLVSVIGSVAKLFWNLGPTSWLQGGLSK